MDEVDADGDIDVAGSNVEGTVDDDIEGTVDDDTAVPGLSVPVEGIKILLAGGSVMLLSSLTENIRIKAPHLAFTSAFNRASSSSTELCFSKVFWHFTQRKVDGLLNNP